MKRCAHAIAALTALLFSLVASAAGVFLPASGRVDMVHDFKRDLVYITAGTSVLRYDRANAQFLQPITLGGNLKGIDISADAGRLAVADFARSYGPGEVVVHIVDLDNGLAVSQLRAPVDSDGETGSFSVAFGADDTLLVSTSYMGSGWLPLRKFDLATGAVQLLEVVTNATMLTASGDRTRLGFAESNISDGRWGRYNFATGALEHRTGYDDGTSWFNYEIGVNRNGTQLAIPTYGGTYFYNDQLARVAILGTYAGPQPIGVAYHPVQDRVYLPWTQSNQVRVYDTTNFTQVGAITTGTIFRNEGNFAYVNGRTKLSADGSLLMVTVPGGLELHQLYAPLSAQVVEVETLPDTAATFFLGGTIGTSAFLTYEIIVPPGSGTAVASNSMVTYTPNPGFTGVDRIGYLVRYGLAEAYSYVFIVVAAPNAPPVAGNVSASGNEDTAIPVALQGSDPEGATLAYTLLSSPAFGTLSGAAPSLVYTPAANWFGTDSFTYKVSDGSLESAVASVTITVQSVNDAPVAGDASLTVAEDSDWIDVPLVRSDVEGGTPLVAEFAGSAMGSLQVVSSTGGWRYKPLANWHGTATVTYRVTDGSLLSNWATLTITVTPVNDPPIAVNDWGNVRRRGQVYVPVLMNDTDADGDPLTIVSVTKPPFGTASISGANVLYTAPRDSTGSFTLQYTVSDGRGGTAVGNIVITVTK